MPNRRPRTPATPEQPSPERLVAIGAELRAAREARGEDLADIATYLRIRPHYLEALERGDAQALPARPYAIGFLRAYADHLGLGGSGLVARLKEAMAAAATPDLGPREPLAEGRRPAGALVAASLLLAAGIYGGYYMLTPDSRAVLETVAEVPGQQPEPVASPPMDVRPEPVPATPAAAVPVMAVATPSAASLPAPENSPLPASLPVADVTSAIAAESAGASGVAPSRPIAVLDVDAAPPADRSESGAEARIVLLARESSWVQVRSLARDWVRTRTLTPGERFALPDRTDLALWTGNAGGLELLLDGRSVGLAGAPGAVVKDLPLAPDALRQRLVSATP